MSRYETIPEHKSDPPLPRIKEKRYCPCGARLSSYNLSDTCSICQGKVVQENIAKPKAPSKRSAWRRDLTLAPTNGATPPVPQEGVRTAEDMLVFVAHECGLCEEEVRACKRGGDYQRNAARAIFVYLVYKDLCRGNVHRAAALLGLQEQRIRWARDRIEGDELPKKVSEAIERIRAHYKSALQAAA